MNDSAVARMVLGAQLGEQTALFESLLLFGGLLLVLMLAVVFLLYLRRRLWRSGLGDAGVLTLEELRRLRDSGAVTIAEYERLRAGIIDAMTSGASSESGLSAR